MSTSTMPPQFPSVITAAGFAVLVLADFKPIRYFGVFTGFTMVTAWMGDVFILPARAAILRLWDGASKSDVNSCYRSE